MPDNSTKKIELFTQLTTQILVLSTAGIAAGVAFLQISGVKGWPVGLIIACFISFILALGNGILGLMVVIGQIDKSQPNFNQCGVRLPNLLAMIFFGCGILLFLSAAIVHFFTIKPEVPAAPIATPVVTDKLLERIKTLSSSERTTVEAFINSGFKMSPPLQVPNPQIAPPDEPKKETVPNKERVEAKAPKNKKRPPAQKKSNQE